MEYNNYLIFERENNGRRKIGSVSSDDPKTAFMLAMNFVRRCYKESNEIQPMFDTWPRYFAEPSEGAV